MVDTSLLLILWWSGSRAMQVKTWIKLTIILLAKANNYQLSIRYSQSYMLICRRIGVRCRGCCHRLATNHQRVLGKARSWKAVASRAQYQYQMLAYNHLSISHRIYNRSRTHPCAPATCSPNSNNTYSMHPSFISNQPNINNMFINWQKHNGNIIGFGCSMIGSYLYIYLLMLLPLSAEYYWLLITAMHIINSMQAFRLSFWACSILCSPDCGGYGTISQAGRRTNQRASWETLILNKSITMRGVMAFWVYYLIRN